MLEDLTGLFVARIHLYWVYNLINPLNVAHHYSNMQWH